MTKIKINVNDVMDRKLWDRVIVPKEIRRLVYSASMKGIDFLEVDRHVIDEMMEKHNEYLEATRKLTETARNNNKGIAFEKSGDIDSAIAIYEENLKIGYTASHSYERLMIIYRKLKRYEDEIRVIEFALNTYGDYNPEKWVERLEKVNLLLTKQTQ